MARTRGKTLSCLRNYYLDQKKTALTNLRAGADHFSVEGIHDFRVAVKRLRAYFALVNSITPAFDASRSARLLKPIFKAAGKVRDCHVLEERVRAAWEKSPLNLSEYYNDLKERELLERGRFVRVFGRFDKTVFDTILRSMDDALATITDELIGVRAELRLSGAADNLIGYRHKTLEAGDYHKIRIQTKETRYTLEVVQTCLGDSDSLKKLNRSLRDVHRALGLWHDRDVELDKLQSFLDSYGDRELFDSKSYATYADILRAERERNLSDFEERWREFLETFQAWSTSATGV